MKNDEWRYGPAGFTNAPEVRALLLAYERIFGTAKGPDETDLVHFEGLPLHEAEQLLKLLPEANRRDRQNQAPSFEEFVELGRDFPEIRFHGYRITPVRWDERISIEGYYYPDGLEAERLLERVSELASEPDEYGSWGFRGQRMVRAWWD